MLSSKLLFIFLLVFVVACSSDEHTTSDSLAQALPEEAAEKFRERCDLSHIALDCAKYAYRIKQTDPALGLTYAQKACDLKDQTSCFNVEQIKRRSIEHNSNIIRSQQDQVLSCYVNHTEDKSHAGFSLKKEEQHKVLNMQFFISPKGQLDHVSVEGRKLSDKFKHCVADVFMSKKFIGSDAGQRIDYGLILPFIEGPKTEKKNDSYNW